MNLVSGTQRISQDPIFYDPKIKLIDLEKEWIKRALLWHYGCVTSAAIATGLSRQTIYRKLYQHNLWRYTRRAMKYEQILSE